MGELPSAAVGHRVRSIRATTLAAAALALAAAPSAHADAFDRIFHEYQQTGQITPCKYSQSELEQAQDEVPNDVEAYAPDFPAALETALEQRAAGGCDKPASPSPSAGGATPAAPSGQPPAGSPPAPPAPGVTSTPSPSPTPSPAPAASDAAIARTAATATRSDAGTPAPVVALAVLGGLLALAGLAYGVAHWLAWDPRWARRTRHAFAEAGWRTQNTWSDFTDWVRLGR